jgi:hypothetical protein
MTGRTRFWAGDPRRRELAASLRRIAPGAHVLRIRPDGAVTAYRADRTILRANRTRAQDERIGQLLRHYYQGVDWTAAHDFYLAEATLHAAPLPGVRGSQPATDRTFGSALGPVFLPSTQAAVGGPS